MKLKHTALRLDFSFFATLALLMLTGEDGVAVTALFSCIFHELSHLLTMAVFRVPVDTVTLYGAGIRISSQKIQFTKPVRRIIILLSGCVGNFAAAVLLGALGFETAAVINLLIGILNLSPSGELDGAVLLKMALVQFCRPEKIDRVMKVVGIISSVLTAAAIFLSGGASLSVMITVLYMFAISVL